ncbi:hypothetical protein GGS26DRAFT_577651 [Hypomontagnella submonticulosa]|nr:hypothetical protein GGS26DRAFT_577651 [Hypomontagnella submonticulosa]
MSPPSREQLLQTTRLFLDAFNEFTPEGVVRHRSPTCTHRLLPATLNSPTQSNADYANLVASLQPIMPVFRLRLVDGVEPAVDEASRKVTLHLKSHSQTPVGLYENEYVWVLTLSQDGKSVDDVLEFADSLYTAEWLPKIKKAAEEAAKK